MNLLFDLNQANAENKISIAVFIDLTRAFNSINDTILLSKLEQYGFRGDTLEFFRSYLSNRPHRTRIGDVLSTPLISNLGIAQGSTLGPLLFNIYVNDIIDSIDDCSIIAYADDTIIYCSGHCFGILQARIQASLTKFYQASHLNSRLIT